MKLYYSIILGSVLVTNMAMAQLAADPWANKTAQINEGITNGSWSTSAPNYVGPNTTWTKAQGQREIAPDVNITNMLLMTQHLRNMGYQIPDGLDNLINTAPEKLRLAIYESMMQLKRSNHPVANSSKAFANIFEKKTGLSIDNLISNSLRLMNERR